MSLCVPVTPGFVPRPQSQSRSPHCLPAVLSGVCLLRQGWAGSGHLLSVC